MLLAPEFIDMHTKRYIDALLGKGLDVCCVSRQDPKPEGHPRYTYIKFPLVYFTMFRSVNTIKQFLIDISTAILLRQIWHISGSDIVHVLFINKKAYQCSIANLHPLVLTSLGSDINNLFSEDNQGKFDNTFKQKISRALKTADLVTADSNKILIRCQELAGISLPSTLFYFGIDVNLFRPGTESEKRNLRRTLGIPEGSKVFLSPRRLIPSMQHDLVLKAYSEYVKNEESNSVLLFRRHGCYDRDYENELQILASHLRLNKQIIWVNELDYQMIPTLYSLSDLVMNFPKEDGLPVTLFEVSACMSPFLTSNLPSYEEFLKQGDFFCITGNDIKAISTTMRRILTFPKDEILIHLLRNRQLVEKSAEINVCIDKMVNSYSNLIKDSSLLGPLLF